jgi:hypothetical protein
MGLRIRADRRGKAKERQLSGLNNQDIVTQYLAEREKGESA